MKKVFMTLGLAAGLIFCSTSAEAGIITVVTGGGNALHPSPVSGVVVSSACLDRIETTGADGIATFNDANDACGGTNLVITYPGSASFKLPMTPGRYVHGIFTVIIGGGKK